jgi:asparagine synthase (glutamine-hydrolysing)
MADSSIVPTLLLSEFTSAHVKVALGGDGADELFWGYETFFAHRIGEWYEKIPSHVQQWMCALVSKLPVSHGYMSMDFKAKKFLSGFETSKGRRNTYWLSAFTPKELSSILTYEVDESVILKSSDSFYKNGTDFWDSLQSEYLRGYLAEDILTKVDRASMTYGLEVRAPFLDLNLVNFAVSLDMRHKYRGRSGKYILREVMEDYLPSQIIKRSKKGFNIPIGLWIKNELRGYFTEKILNGGLVQSGLFKREGLAILLESHLSSRVDQRKKLWTLLVLALWIEEWHG